jgi:hypothetical protein
VTIQLTLSVTPVVDGLPDADTDVIVFLSDGTSTIGAIDADGWVDSAGTPFAFYDERVVAWAHFPTLSQA